MKKISKKLLCVLLAGMIGTACVSCGPDKTSEESSGAEESTPKYTLDTYEFKQITSDGNTVTLNQYEENNPTANGFVEYSIFKQIKDKNYVKLDVETDVDLVGWIYYYNTAKPEETNAEKFFIEAGSTEFKMFLDGFRVGARGAFDKTLTKITFQNVDSTKVGTFTFKSLSVSDRSFDTNEDWRISNGDSIIGTKPFYGGCITYLEKLNQDVCEYMDGAGNIVVDRDVCVDEVDLLSESVNLVNIYDLGREIQPSYYANVTKENGYDPDYDPEDKDSYYQGLSGVPIYNPIQCGDFGGHTPQIIDYVYKENYLYIKMKAQEWFFYTNIQANGYIECTYYFDDGGAIMVDNVYTDFSQFYNLENTSVRTQETPATYFIYPFNYFYCETKQGTIFDPNTAEQNGTNQGKASMRSQVTSAEYFYALNGKNVVDDWCAFVNENKFGVGIFLPNADNYIASRGRRSNSYNAEKLNHLYSDQFFSFGEDEIIPSYAAMNYSYINPAINRKMVNFIPFEYTYALFIGDTTEMKSVFGELRDSNTLTNEHLLDTTKGWPAK